MPQEFDIGSYFEGQNESLGQILEAIQGLNTNQGLDRVLSAYEGFGRDVAGIRDSFTRYSADQTALWNQFNQDWMNYQKEADRFRGGVEDQYGGFENQLSQFRQDVSSLQGDVASSQQSLQPQVYTGGLAFGPSPGSYFQQGSRYTVPF